MDQYLHPADEDFGPLLVSNLLGKYESVGLVGAGQAATADLPTIAYELLPDPGQVSARPKSRLLTIKEGSRSQTQIRGYYNFDFALSGPPEVLELAVLAGVGRYNAEGFGCVRVINTKPIFEKPDFSASP
jgi:CRISPR-associated endoribonuclease Cas6